MQNRPSLDLSAALAAAFEAGQAKLIAATTTGTDEPEITSEDVVDAEAPDAAGFGKFAPPVNVTIEEPAEEDLFSSLEHTIRGKELQAGRLSREGEICSLIIFLCVGCFWHSLVVMSIFCKTGVQNILLTCVI